MNKKNLHTKDNFARNLTIVVIAIAVIIASVVIWMTATSKSSESDHSPANTINDGFVMNSKGGLEESKGYNLNSAPKITDMNYSKDNINVTMYVDYDCPHCLDFEKAVGGTLDEMLESGEISTVSVMPVAFLTDWSVSAQNMASCFANYQPDMFQSANRQIMNAQETRPDKNTLYASIAKDAGTEVSSDTKKCVNGKQFRKFVESSTSNATTGVYPPALGIGGIKGTPSIFINGESYSGEPDAKTMRLAIKQVSEGKPLNAEAPAASIGD